VRSRRHVGEQAVVSRKRAGLPTPEENTMPVNIKLNPAECVRRFVPIAALKGYAADLSFENLANASLTIQPPPGRPSPIREVVWECNIPVVATNADRSNFEKLVEEVIGAAANVVGTLSQETGFASGAAIAGQLARTVTNVGRIFGERFDQREIAVRPVPITFERTGDSVTGDLYYGYVLSGTSRWLREDTDDPKDTGYFKCERLEDTLIRPLSGKKMSPELPGRTGLFESPLLSAGPFLLPGEINEISVEFITTALSQIDFEFTTTELFMSVVQQIKLKIYAGSKAFVDGFVNPVSEKGVDGKQVSEAIEKTGFVLEKALRTSRQFDIGPTADPELIEARRIISAVNRGEVSDLRSMLGDLPANRLRAVADALGEPTDAIRNDPNRLTRVILGRLFP
jgi:hypothetical protein